MPTLHAFPLYPAPRRFSPMGGSEACFASVLKAGLKTPEPWVDRIKTFFVAAGIDAPVRVCTKREGFVLASVTVKDHWAPTDIKPGGFALRINEHGLTLRSLDVSGFFAGLQSVWQLAETSRPVPRGEILDHPTVKLRSIQLDLGRQPESLRELKRIIRQQARYRYNQVQLYLENGIKLPVFGDAADPQGLSIADWNDLQDYSNALGVDLVPSLNLLGHTEKLTAHPKFADLAEIKHGARHPNQAYGGVICPELPESRALVATAIAEMAAISKSKWMMVGLDECWSLGSHPLTRAKLDEGGWAGTIFKEWITFLHGECTKHGKQMWMWEDMLFYHKGSFGQIPTDIGMNTWHYQHVESIPMYSFQNWGRIDAFARLSALGHPILLCPIAVPNQILSQLRYADSRPLEGFCIVQWEGSRTVQEGSHIERAVAAGILWTGEMPNTADTMRAVCDLDDRTSKTLGSIVTQRFTQLPSKHGGSHTCPRFWSWPENGNALLQRQFVFDQWSDLNVRHEYLDMLELQIIGDLVGVAADYIRENTALAGRQMIQYAKTQSTILDDAIIKLEGVLDLARQLVDKARTIHDRYTLGLPPRPMVRPYVSQVMDLAGLLDRLKVFQAAPGPSAWPFAAFSIHIDGLTLDACAHLVILHTSDDNVTWTKVYEGHAHLPGTLEGEFVMSFPIPRPPRFVKLEVGGFASIGITRVRVESLHGTTLPGKLIESVGYVINPENLLDFDRKIAIFNPPDVLTNWVSLEPPKHNFVVLEF